MDNRKLLNSLINGRDPITDKKFATDDPLCSKEVRHRLIEIREEVLEKREIKKAEKQSKLNYRIDIEKLKNTAIITPEVSFSEFAKSIANSVETSCEIKGEIAIVKTKPSYIKQSVFKYLVSIGALVKQTNLYGTIFYSTTKYGEELGILVEEDTRYPGGIATSITVRLQKKLIADLSKIMEF